MNSMGSMLKVTFLWVADHRNIEEKERVDGLAKRGSAVASFLVSTVRVLLFTVKTESTHTAYQPRISDGEASIPHLDHESSCAVYTGYRSIETIPTDLTNIIIRIVAEKRGNPQAFPLRLPRCI